MQELIVGAALFLGTLLAAFVGGLYLVFKSQKGNVEDITTSLKSQLSEAMKEPARKADAAATAADAATLSVDKLAALVTGMIGGQQQVFDVMQASNKELREERERQAQAIRDWERRHADQEKRLNEYSGTVTDLLKNQEEMKRTDAEQQRQIDQLSKERDDATTALALALDGKRAAEEHVVKLENELTELRGQVTKLTKTHEAEITDLKRRIDELERQMSELSAQLKETRAERDEYKRQVDEARQTIADRDLQIATLTAELATERANGAKPVPESEAKP